MKLKRYEILLPLTYNDGTPIEESHFLKTNEELLEEFSATTIDTIIATGSWLYQGVLYNDRLLRIRIDVEASDKNTDFLRHYKEKLKERFKQIDIWITSYDIEIL